MKRLLLLVPLVIIAGLVWLLVSPLVVASTSAQIEIKNVMPVRQMLGQAREVRIYPEMNRALVVKAPVILSERSNPTMFHLLKATNDFGEYGIKTWPGFRFIVIVPGHPPQQYGYTMGRVGKWSTTGEMGMTPATFQTWMSSLLKKPS